MTFFFDTDSKDVYLYILYYAVLDLTPFAVIFRI